MADIAARGDKQSNCTHLHDLALLAAAHAGDSTGVRYDILVCDPLDGLVVAEIRRDGVMIHQIAHRDDIITAPPALAGISLFKLRNWIETLDGLEREAARLLQWGAILAHGRIIPLERQSDASRMPPNCFTFQPDNKGKAKRVGIIIDFCREPIEPLDHFDGNCFKSRRMNTDP